MRDYRTWALGQAGSYLGRRYMDKVLNNTWKSLVGGNKRMVAGGNWTGKFKAPVKRPRRINLKDGVHDEYIYSDAKEQPMVGYLGITSYPCVRASSTGVSTQFQTSYQFIRVIEAALRYFFRYQHPGRYEFQTFDQTFESFNIPTTANYSTAEGMVIMYQTPDGSTITAGTDFIYMNYDTDATPRPAYNTLTKLATAIANEMYVQWQDGKEPLYMKSWQGALVGTTGLQFAVAGMNLNQLRFRTNCTTVLTVQNQTIADDGTGGTTNTLANTTIDISANPLHGRIFYFSDIAPKFATGYDYVNNDGPDEWGAINLSTPDSDSDLQNVYAPTKTPEGCWMTVPKAQYFSNCTGTKDVQLNPGEIKEFKLRFKFGGRLVDWLRADISNFKSLNPAKADIENLAYHKGMGQCAIMAVEKRIRNATTKVQLSYTVKTYTHATVRMNRQSLTVRTRANDIPE